MSGRVRMLKGSKAQSPALQCDVIVSLFRAKILTKYFTPSLSPFPMLSFSMVNHQSSQPDSLSILGDRCPLVWPGLVPPAAHVDHGLHGKDVTLLHHTDGLRK